MAIDNCARQKRKRPKGRFMFAISEKVISAPQAREQEWPCLQFLFCVSCRPCGGDVYESWRRCQLVQSCLGPGFELGLPGL